MARTPSEREAERRALKLAEIQEQVEEGQLSIRQMTPAERKRYGTDEKPKRDENAPKKRRRT